MMTMNLEDPHQVEEVIDKQIEKHHHEAHAPAHALQGMADALPALGIVAAVLGIIKTMGAISQPPEYLGKLIGSALVGTFLGVFLAYGFVGPFASRLGQVVDEEGQFYKIIKDVLVAHLHGNAAQVSVEIGRGQIPSAAQPSFAQLEEALGAVHGIDLPPGKTVDRPGLRPRAVFLSWAGDGLRLGRHDPPPPARISSVSQRFAAATTSASVMARTLASIAASLPRSSISGRPCACAIRPSRVVVRHGVLRQRLQ